MVPRGTVPGTVAPPTSTFQGGAEVDRRLWTSLSPADLRSDIVRRGSAVDGSSAASAYEDVKRSYVDTDASCQAEGLTFIPVVCEADGGGGYNLVWGVFLCFGFFSGLKKNPKLSEKQRKLKKQVLGSWVFW